MDVSNPILQAATDDWCFSLKQVTRFNLMRLEDASSSRQRKLRRIQGVVKDSIATSALRSAALSAREG